MRTSTTRADYIGERLAAIKAYSDERAEKDKALIEELVKALRQSRHYVYAAGDDENSETNRLSGQLLFDIDAILRRAKEAGYG